MVRTPCCDERGMKKGTWTPEEDRKLIAYVTRYGCWNWRQLPKFAGLSRCGKSCRLRWLNYLRPNIKRGNYTREEEEIIIRMHQQLGNKWSAIAAQLQGRTDNEVKNHWHTNLKKRFMMNKHKDSSVDEGLQVRNSSEPNPSAAAAADFPNPEITNSDLVIPQISDDNLFDYPELWSPQPSTSEVSSMTGDTAVAITRADSFLMEDNATSAMEDNATSGNTAVAITRADSFLMEDNATSAMEDNATSGNTAVAITRADSFLMEDNATSAMETSFYADFSNDFWTAPFLADTSYSDNNPTGLFSTPLMEPEFLYPSLFDGDFLYGAT